MEEEKPFACPVSDCGLQFVNEDHLTVHKKKHEMSLTLTPSVTASSTFVDQTPTPSRFLNALDTELFPNDNPFDATFRKVNALGGGSFCQLTIPEPSSLNSSLSDSDVLNTPSITLAPETEGDGPSLHQDTNSASKSLSKQNEVLNHSSESLPFTPSDQMSSESTSLGESVVDSSCSTEASVDTVIQDVSSTVVQGTVKTSSSTFPVSVRRENVNRINVVQTPVITSVGLPGSTVRSNSSSVPVTVVVTKAVTSGIPVVSSSASPSSVSTSQTKSVGVTQPVIQTVPIPPIVQIIIRLPNGQTMPVQIPVVVTTAASAPSISAQPVMSTTEMPPKVASTQSLAKMKLKALIGSQKVSSSVNGDLRSCDIPDTSAPRLQPTTVAPSQNSVDGTSLNGSPPSSPHQPASTGRRRREIEDDPDEKRRKSLERNRAAATRCRQKRKQWIKALEKKAEELACVNAHLQNEVEMLRHEVAHLKTMLLAHKDCPITQQQRASGACEPTTTLHTFPLHISTQSSLTLPHISETPTEPSAQNVSIMEVEVSSSQSSYFSDGSESSVAKEC